METAALSLASRPFLGQWQTLVSTTNWEKGRIISDWRNSLAAADADRSDYSDESWSQLVGNVTPQHVGRLRRVHERFGQVRETYTGLYWTHFQAALDWEDAEMWLEGAKSSDWSVAQMRAQRAETLGEVANLEMETAAATEWDARDEEGAEAPFDTTSENATNLTAGDDGGAKSKRGASKGESNADELASDERHGRPAADSHEDATGTHELPPPILATLPSLPADVTDAFEAFKLCILRHKLAGWMEVSCDDVLASLYALKEFALAESVE